MNSFLTGASATAPVNVSGIEREATKRPVGYKYTLGVQREIGWHTCARSRLCRRQTQNLAQNWNYNAIPAGARFLPENRDLSGRIPPRGLQPNRPNPGALPDVFLRPILGFGDINISSPVGKSRYDSLQMQLTRRFTGGFELAGSYTWAKGFATGINQNNPLPASAAQITQQHPGARRRRQLHDRHPGRQQAGEMGRRRSGSWTTGAFPASARSRPEASRT